MSFRKELINRGISGLIYISFFIYAAAVKDFLFLKIILTFFVIISYFEFYNITKSSKNILLKFGFPIIYLIIPMISIYFIKFKFGSIYLVFLILMVCINDMSAFIIGKCIGKQKFSNISPNKTIEGFLGSLVFCLLATPYLITIFELKLNINYILLGFIICIASNLGDLLESFIKRKFNIKDSGEIMIGHGGMLDRIDSLLITSPVFYLILKQYLN